MMQRLEESLTGMHGCCSEREGWRDQREGGSLSGGRVCKREALRFAIRAAGEAGAGGSEAPSVADPDDDPSVANPDVAIAAALEAGQGGGPDGNGVEDSVADGGALAEKGREVQDDIQYWGRL